MTTLSVERKEGDRPARFQSFSREPMRMFHQLLNWDPFAEMSPLWSGSEAAEFMPAFEVKETKEGFVFKADLPGVKESDLHVGLSNNRLSVTGKREQEKSEKSDTYYTYERSYGSFTRAFTLPEGVDADHVKAELKQGVLTIEVPKRPEALPKKVPVQTP
jgi:HSP20 family protein